MQNIADILVLFSNLLMSFTQNPYTVHLKDESPVVGTPVQGAPGAVSVTQFLGIPFAEPPVGENRFRAPVPKSPWTKDLHSKVPPACMQPAIFMDPVMYHSWWNPSIAANMQEDCLYLNVWVPHVPTDASGLAVMLWIHGGGFYAGSSTPDLYDGRILASQEGLIVVSIQYRLGIFGFAYSDLNSDSIPGNIGLLDQILAMDWVKRNIGRFGGDPERVTLFGQSAGSTSIGYHLLSPTSHPYFDQVVLHSGSPLSPWALLSTETVKNRTVETAIRLGCNRGGPKGIVKCMKDVNAVDLLYNSFFTPDPMVVIWGPIIDGKILEKPIDQLLANGTFKKKNILLGSNKREFNMFFHALLPEIYSVERTLKISHLISSDQQFDQIVDRLLPLRLKNDKNFKEGLKNLYSLNNNREEVLDEIFGDMCFTCPVLQFSKFWSQQEQATYVYSFDYHAPSYPTPGWMGALHGDELAFIFGKPLQGGETASAFSNGEKTLSKSFMKYLGNFAKHGNPNAFLNPSMEHWLPYCRHGLILVIENNLAIGRYFSQKEQKCEFWGKHVPKLPML